MRLRQQPLSRLLSQDAIAKGRGAVNGAPQYHRASWVHSQITLGSTLQPGRAIQFRPNGTGLRRQHIGVANCRRPQKVLRVRVGPGRIPSMTFTDQVAVLTKS
jgi:hypothetical protein